MTSKTDSKTDKLIKPKNAKNVGAATDVLEVVDLPGTVSNKLEVSGNPSGTYSVGTGAIAQSSNAFILQARSGMADTIQMIRDHLTSYRPKKQAKQAIMLLDILENLLDGYEGLHLPPINMSLPRDGSIAISWRVGSALFGAAIRKDPTESSWFLIQGDIEKGYKADGYLDDPNFETQVPSLIQLLITTYLRQK